MLKEIRSRSFANGIVYALHTEDGYPLEVTDTFLPNYTKDAINDNENTLKTYELGDRSNRWMIGVSCMSGCPVGCKFCLEENTLILMSDFSKKKIKDIKIGDKVIGNILRKKMTPNSQDYATNYSSLATVKNIFKREYDGFMYKIYTEDGDCIEVTENHPIAYQDCENKKYRKRFTEAKNLKAGDILFKFLYFEKDNITYNDAFEFGWLYGFIKGDGIVSKNTNRASFRCSVSQSNDLIFDCENICHKFNIGCSSVNVNSCKNENAKTNYRLVINKSGLNVIDELYEKFKTLDDFKKGFIAGFYDAEGFSFNNNTIARFCNCDIELLEYTKRFIEYFGYEATIKLYDSAKESGNEQNCYILETNINRSDFCSKFHPNNEKSLFLCNSKIKSLKEVKIVRIEKNVKKLTVYNFETSSNTYYANGILVHNCATGKLKRWRNLTAEEIVEQVDFIINKNPDYKFEDAWEHKINYTRMGEPFLNIDEVRKAIEIIDAKYPNTHHYISTIGLQGSDFSWIKDNITLQLSLHSLDEERRHNLIPISNLMSIEELGQVRTSSNLKTTINMTLVDFADFDINILKKYFNPKYFFIKLSPINENEVSIGNNMGSGVIEKRNLL